MGLKRIEPAFGALPIAEVEKADVQAFLTAVARELAPESVYDLRNRLSGLFSTAEEWGWLPAGAHPVRGRLRLPRKERVREKRILEPSQLALLVKELKAPYNVLVQLAVLSGLRRGKISALR